MSDDMEKKEAITEETQTVDLQTADPSEKQETATTFSENALDKMIDGLRDDTADVVPENFEFGEKKVDKKKMGKFIIKLISAAICLGAFLVNGILMTTVFESYREYLQVVPVWVQIILILASLYGVSVITNIIGGAKQDEHSAAKEE